MRAPPDTPIGAAGLHNTTDRSPASRAPNFFSIFFPSAPNARDRTTKIAHHKIGCRRSKTAPRESAMHGRVRFSIVTAVVTTTDREFRVNLPRRRLLLCGRHRGQGLQQGHVRRGARQHALHGVSGGHLPGRRGRDGVRRVRARLHVPGGLGGADPRVV